MVKAFPRKLLTAGSLVAAYRSGFVLIAAFAALAILAALFTVETGCRQAELTSCRHGAPVYNR